MSTFSVVPAGRNLLRLVDDPHPDTTDSSDDVVVAELLDAQFSIRGSAVE